MKIAQKKKIEIMSKAFLGIRRIQQSQDAHLHYVTYIDKIHFVLSFCFKIFIYFNTERFASEPYPGMVGILRKIGQKLKFVVVSVKKLDGDELEKTVKKQNIKSKQKIKLLHNVMYFDNAEPPEKKIEWLFLDLKNQIYYSKDEKSGEIKKEGTIYSVTFKKKYCVFCFVKYQICDKLKSYLHLFL